MNLAAMRAARDEAAEYLEQAIEQLDGSEQSATTALTYVQLARVAVERFEEAARGS